MSSAICLVIFQHVYAVKMILCPIRRFHFRSIIGVWIKGNLGTVSCNNSICVNDRILFNRGIVIYRHCFSCIGKDIIFYKCNGKSITCRSHSESCGRGINSRPIHRNKNCFHIICQIGGLIGDDKFSVCGRSRIIGNIGMNLERHRISGCISICRIHIRCMIRVVANSLCDVYPTVLNPKRDIICRFVRIICSVCHGERIDQHVLIKKTVICSTGNYCQIPSCRQIRYVCRIIASRNLRHRISDRCNSSCTDTICNDIRSILDRCIVPGKCIAIRCQRRQFFHGIICSRKSLSQCITKIIGCIIQIKLDNLIKFKSVALLNTGYRHRSHLIVVGCIDRCCKCHVPHHCHHRHSSRGGYQFFKIFHNLIPLFQCFIYCLMSHFPA